ncbi:hypothetical protein AB6A23_04930 [Paenibacillus tarimensis]
MKKLLAMLFIMLFIAGCSKPSYDFLYTKARIDNSSCPQAAIVSGNECYTIPDLAYNEAIDWHLNRLATLGWEGNASNDFTPFSFIYRKEEVTVQLTFYPLNSTTEGNLITIEYDKPGTGLLITPDGRGSYGRERG